jgi:hypothetical protein
MFTGLIIVGTCSYLRADSASLAVYSAALLAQPCCLCHHNSIIISNIGHRTTACVKIVNVDWTPHNCMCEDCDCYEVVALWADLLQCSSTKLFSIPQAVSLIVSL